VLLGRVGFDPQAVLNMTAVELMSHITHILPPSGKGGDDGDTKTHVNTARLRRKNKSSSNN
jgi:hypothetical protein